MSMMCLSPPRTQYGEKGHTKVTLWNTILCFKVLSLSLSLIGWLLYQAGLVCSCCQPHNAQSLNIHNNLQSHLMTHPHVRNRLMGWWGRRCCCRGLWMWVVREERPMPGPQNIRIRLNNEYELSFFQKICFLILFLKCKRFHDVF